MIEDIKKALETFGGEWKEKKGVWTFKTVIAERKAFLSKKKLTYSAKMRIDDEAKEVTFTEMLTEAGSGLSSGDAGVGFKTETYNTMGGARKGTIEEQSTLFGKKFEYKFNYAEIRTKVEELTKSNGYKFTYKLTGIGL